MIPPSPPADESEDRDSGDDDDSKPSDGDQDPNIRFHVTLEEGDEDSVAAMWRKLVGWCRKLGEKVNSWWRTKWIVETVGATPKNNNKTARCQNPCPSYPQKLRVCVRVSVCLYACARTETTHKKRFSVYVKNKNKK